MLDRQALQELHVAFVAESEEGLAAAEDGLLRLERMPHDEEALASVFRAVHTLKGNAGIFDLSALVTVAHAMEELLGRLRGRTLLVTPAVVSRLLSGVDILRSLLQEPSTRALSEPERELVTVLTDLRGSEDPSNLARGTPSLRKQSRGIRIDPNRLERLLDLTGEIGVARGHVAELLEDPGTRSIALEAHRDAERLHLELQELVMKLRMVPVGPILRQLVRTVRDTARLLEKEADLLIEGEDVEVDVTIVESLKDPLVHMIRNSLDHGIESPDIRRAMGKSPAGQLVIRSFHDAGSIVIELRDDGAGLHKERILARARERGLVASDAILTDQQMCQLIFEPGFSTAESITEVSGRGVGLDVVKRNIESIHGTVTIDSAPGTGTRTTIRLPLTLAVMDGLRVECAGQSYILPMQAVVETLEYRPESATAELIPLRSEMIPVLPLWTTGGASSNSHRQNVVVVRHLGGHAGLIVDELAGECRAIVKPLARPLRSVGGFSGSAILPSGRVALIVDVAGLLQAEIDRRSSCFQS